MSSKRPLPSRLPALLAALALASGSVSCASNGAPEPWACGLAGQVLGGGAGAAAGLGLADEDKEVGAAIGAGAAGAIVIGVAAWQICEAVSDGIDARARAERERRAELRRIQEEKEAAEEARREEERRRAEEARRKAEEERLAAERARERAALVSQEKPELVLAGAAFDSGSASLSPAAQGQLNEVAATLRDFPELKVRITGHSDSVGDSGRNLALSKRRAESVRGYLVLQGVASERLEAIGLGENSPIAPNDTAAGRAKNRRVELDLTE